MLCGIAAQEHERVLEDRARSPVGFKQTEHRSVEIDHGFYVFDEYAQVAQRWPDGRGHDILLSAWNMVFHCPREARHLACTGSARTGRPLGAQIGRAWCRDRGCRDG